MEGKGILLHKHSVALVDGEAKSPDPSILRYGEIAINYATDHETISFKNQNDEIATFKTHKLYTQLLGDKQDKTDDSLTTQDKTIVGALNELKTDLDDSVEPYVVNLTNLLSANDSEPISAAIGGIENLNSTISRNQVIFGVLATGTVAVGIRVFGNQTTLNYFVDSVLGLTINEITITNTDNTLSKTVETHAVLTENMVINSLNSDETTLPLSAAQGKILATDKQDKTDDTLGTTDKTIVGAINELNGKSDIHVIDYLYIAGNAQNPDQELLDTALGGWDNLVNAIQTHKAIIAKQSSDGTEVNFSVSASFYEPLEGGETISMLVQVSQDRINVILLNRDNTDTVSITIDNIRLNALNVLNVSTLFADSATITSELSSQIAIYGNQSAPDFPVMRAGSIGNIKPTWIRTTSGVTNMMCIADNKIWYFEIQGTTVQRASLAIS